MKIPKKIYVCGRTVNISYSDQISDMALFNANDRTIIINPEKHQGKHSEELRDTILHECLEAILIYSNLKYTNTGQELYQFDHSTLQHIIIPELLSIINQLSGCIITKAR